MEAGDKIIWDSGFGYEIGYYLGKSHMYYHLKVRLVSRNRGIMHHQEEQVKPYSEELNDKMEKEYGYRHDFK